MGVVPSYPQIRKLKGPKLVDWQRRDWCSSDDRINITCQLNVLHKNKCAFRLIKNGTLQRARFYPTQLALCLLPPFQTHTHTHTHTPSQMFMTRLMELAVSESGSRLTYDKKELALECIVQVKWGTDIEGWGGGSGVVMCTSWQTLYVLLAPTLTPLVGRSGTHTGNAGNA